MNPKPLETKAQDKKYMLLQFLHFLDNKIDKISHLITLFKNIPSLRMSQDHPFTANIFNHGRAEKEKNQILQNRPLGKSMNTNRYFAFCLVTRPKNRQKSVCFSRLITGIHINLGSFQHLKANFSQNTTNIK